MDSDQVLLLYAYQAILANITGAMRAVYMRADRTSSGYIVQFTGVFRYAPTEREEELLREMASELKSGDEEVVAATGTCIVTRAPLDTLHGLGQQLYVRAEEFEGPAISNAPY